MRPFNFDEQLLEFAFGGDPNIRDLNIHLSLVEYGGNTFLELTVTRPQVYKASRTTPTTDLSNWPMTLLVSTTQTLYRKTTQMAQRRLFISEVALISN